MAKKSSMSFGRAYGFAWFTLAFFLVSLVGHWVLGWFAFVQEQIALGQSVEFTDYAIEMGRDTLENWQSEFLQLLWQVGGLAFLLYIGSPQSKEGDERKEEKLDEILRLLDSKRAEQIIRQLEQKYPQR
jgi:hypothetical protein